MMRAPGAVAESSGLAVRSAFVSVTFFALAGLLWAHPWPYQPPYGAAPPFPAAATIVTTAYHPNLTPEAHFASRTHACSACHTKFHEDPNQKLKLELHHKIVLKHGMNNRCMNCHSETNRDALADDWGNDIPYDQPQLLCRKCHGEVYRDWVNGAHGRSNGFWDSRAGARDRRLCDECHDPHRPPFPPMQPAPPPVTLRMGPQPPPHTPEVKDPLRVFVPETMATAATALPASQPSDRTPDEPPEDF